MQKKRFRISMVENGIGQKKKIEDQNVTGLVRQIDGTGTKEKKTQSLMLSCQKDDRLMKEMSVENEKESLNRSIAVANGRGTGTGTEIGNGTGIVERIETIETTEIESDIQSSVIIIISSSTDTGIMSRCTRKKWTGDGHLGLTNRGCHTMKIDGPDRGMVIMQRGSVFLRSEEKKKAVFIVSHLHI
jgi:hypothetical protein